MYQLRIMSRAERGRLLQAEHDVSPETNVPVIRRLKLIDLQMKELAT